MGRFQESLRDREFIAALNGMKQKQIGSKEAADLLGVSQKSVIRWAREKGLVMYRMHPRGKIFFPKETVLALFRAMGEER